MTNKAKSRYDVNATLQELGMSTIAGTSTQAGRFYEFEIPDCGGRRGLVFEAKDKRLTVGIRLHFQEGCSLLRAAATSDVALSFLGALHFSLQSQALEAQLVTGAEGVEGVIITARACAEEAESPLVEEYINRVRSVVEALHPALKGEGRELIDRVLDAVRPQLAASPEEPTQPDALIVPTFNEEARDRMLGRT
jgi:hypothetical protein